MELGCWTVIAVSVGYSVGCFSPLQDFFPNGVFLQKEFFPQTCCCVDYVHVWHMCCSGGVHNRR